MTFCIFSRSGVSDVRQLDNHDLEALFNKTQSDIYSTRNELVKLKRINESSQANVEKMWQLLEKLEMHQKDDGTILKVRKNLFSYNYLSANLQLEVRNVVSIISIMSSRLFRQLI